MIKKIVFGTLGLMVIAIFFALVAPLFISVDTYKSQIKSKVEAATGRVMTIDGALSIHFFPTASIAVEKVTLSNPAGFDDTKPFATLGALKIEVALMPLLNKNIVIRNFILQDPLIHMQVTKDGRKNWAFASKSVQESQDKPNSNLPPDRPKIVNPGLLPGNIMLNNFEIKNGTIQYSAGCCKPNFELKNLNTTVVIQSSASAASLEGNALWNGKQIDFKGGLGTLQSLLEEQKMEVSLAVRSDLFSLTLDGNYEKGSFNGKETSKVQSLKELAKWIAPSGKPLPTPAPLAFESEGDVRASDVYFNLANIDFKLDGLSAKGGIKSLFTDQKPTIEITLATQELDINPFLPAPAKQSSLENLLIGDAMAQVSERWNDQNIDYSVLSMFNLTSVIRADKILFRNLKFDKTMLNTKIQQGILTADIPNAALYHGTGTLSLSINAQETPATFSSGVILKGVELQPLLQDAANIDTLTGFGDVQINLKGNCRTVKSLVTTLAGDAQVKVGKGYLKGINMADMLHNVSGSFDNAASNQNTEFTNMGASFTIAQGVVSNHDLNVQVKELNVSGEGAVDLPAYTINYHLTPKLLKTTQSATGETTVKQGLAVPLIIEGSLDHPRYRPDLQAVVQDALQDPKKLKEQLKNSREVLKDQLKDPKSAAKNLKGLLQGLGGNR